MVQGSPSSLFSSVVRKRNTSTTLQNPKKVNHRDLRRVHHKDWEPHDCPSLPVSRRGTWTYSLRYPEQKQELISQDEDTCLDTASPPGLPPGGGSLPLRLMGD